MNAIAIALPFGILWFLITLFTSSTNSSQSFREASIVVAGMIIIGLVTKFLLREIIGPFTTIINIAFLYLIVDKVCGTARNTTLKICGWFLGISVLINLGIGLISGA